MKQLKIAKSELNNLLTQAITNLQTEAMPGDEQEKMRSVKFLEEFQTLFKASQAEYFPLSEIIALLVLENQITHKTLRKKLKRSLLISDLSVKIRHSIQSNPEELPELVKLFDELTK